MSKGSKCSSFTYILQIPKELGNKNTFRLNNIELHLIESQDCESKLNRIVKFVSMPIHKKEQTKILAICLSVQFVQISPTQVFV